MKRLWHGGERTPASGLDAVNPFALAVGSFSAPPPSRGQAAFAIGGVAAFFFHAADACPGAKTSLPGPVTRIPDAAGSRRGTVTGSFGPVTALRDVATAVHRTVPGGRGAKILPRGTVNTSHRAEISCHHNVSSIRGTETSRHRVVPDARGTVSAIHDAETPVAHAEKSFLRAETSFHGIIQALVFTWKSFQKNGLWLKTAIGRKKQKQ